ncbi:MAG: threonylcarbamoyl-AMP synthase [Bacillota bacterium]|nr:MAG: threonylcarbamoyl-AMP synthase [Bacillota bacterium]
MKHTIIIKAKDLKHKINQSLIYQTIKAGHTVVFPTETVYGIGGDAINKFAVNEIYKAKGRPSDNPLIMHIARKQDVYLYAKNISKQAKQLMRVFWPGPLTLIFDKKDIVPLETTGGLETVAMRYPDHPIAKQIIKIAKTPLAAPSANISGKPSSTKFKHVFEDLNGRVDIIIDGGDSMIGIESTVIDVTQKIPVILRPGFITQEMIERVLGIKITDASLDHISDKVKSPGMKYTHYKPKGEVILLDGSPELMKRYIHEHSEKNMKQTLICSDELASFFDDPLVKPIGSIHRLDLIAKNLFSALRDMDDLGIDIIYVELFPQTHIGHAIMNRLLKASGYKVIKLS